LQVIRVRVGGLLEVTKMIVLDKFKVLGAVWSTLVFISCFHQSNCEDYSQQQQSQTQQGNNNGYSSPSAPPVIQHQHRNHRTRTGGWGMGNPMESRTGLG